jgi:hypothetical protein
MVFPSIGRPVAWVSPAAIGFTMTARFTPLDGPLSDVPPDMLGPTTVIQFQLMLIFWPVGPIDNPLITIGAVVALRNVVPFALHTTPCRAACNLHGGRAATAHAHSRHHGQFLCFHRYLHFQFSSCCPIRSRPGGAVSAVSVVSDLLFPTHARVRFLIGKKVLFDW